MNDWKSHAAKAHADIETALNFKDVAALAHLENALENVKLAIDTLREEQG